MVGRQALHQLCYNSSLLDVSQFCISQASTYLFLGCKPHTALTVFRIELSSEPSFLFFPSTAVVLSKSGLTGRDF